jgi:hypothetical protein
MIDWQKFYESIELTEQEMKDAILVAKIVKYNKEKNADYWKELEEKTSKPVKK